ncbi:PTS sugar transporter subunit IIA [[Eubacterium] hominis]|uniref:PTS sugar transporter subunit IIA n=1 Tax=[Eubacterium] hominis TaxID=2764325 RepID=UPI003A4D4201
MRRYIFASHHKLAFGLKDTVQFLNNYSSAANQIYDINAYVDDKETDISDQVEQLFASFSKEDEVIVLTDMLGGSVNQKFIPYLSDKTHIITGMNLALAMSLILLPQDIEITSNMIADIVEDCKQQVIYVNQVQVETDEEDE